ncbi:XkdX family protein [Intestinibacillus massiliensis]|nr:XkdX family protein [Intestinibacillus massiliensis]
MTFETIKSNYDRKLWNAKMVAMAVTKGVITAAQYQQITGQEYQ